MANGNTSLVWRKESWILPHTNSQVWKKLWDLDVQARSKKLAGEHCMALYHWRVFWIVVILEHKVVVLFFHQGVRMLCICSLHVIEQRKSTMYRTKWEDQWYPKHWLIGVSDHWGIHYTGRATAIPWRYRILRDGPYGWVVFMVGAIGGDLEASHNT
jgi:hypothetical protein